MLNISFTTDKISVVQMRKNLWGKEKVVGMAQKNLRRFFEKKDFFSEKSQIFKELSETFQIGYPKNLSDNFVNISLPDCLIFLQRLSFENITEKENFHQVIASSVQKLFPGNFSEWESFFKIIKKTPEKTFVLFTSLEKEVLNDLKNLFGEIGIGINAVSSFSFALFELLKFLILEDEVVFYLHLENQCWRYSLFDSFGPIAYGEEKRDAFSLEQDVLAITEEIEKNQNLRVAKIIFGGEKVREWNWDEVRKKISFPIYELGTVVEKFCQKTGIDFESGGISKDSFAVPLGLAFQAKNRLAVNFNFPPASPAPSCPNFSKFSSEIKPMPEKVFSLNFFEGKKKFDFVDLKRKSRFLIFGLFFALFFFLILFFAKSFNFSQKFFFLGRKEITPTYFLPSVTPTPSIDPRLKREDLKISVENGTEKTGFAKETAFYLEKKGYRKVAKSNADRNDYEMTIIKIKEEKKAFLPLILFDLVEKFPKVEVQSLEKENQYDMVVILGRQ